MRNLVLIIFSIFFIFSCKKEFIRHQHNLYLTFEKDSILYEFKSIDVSTEHGFSSYPSEDIRTESATFKFESWCTFTNSKPEPHLESFYVNFFQFDTSQILSQHGIDETFSEGIKNIASPSFLIIPDDSIEHLTLLRYVTDFPTRLYFDHTKCSDPDLDYFEITHFEKLETDGQIQGVIIEAKFDVEFCNPNGEKIELRNGKLRYYYDF